MMQRSNEKARRGATHDGLREQCSKRGDYIKVGVIAESCAAMDWTVGKGGVGHV